jgi:hypothetical protein
MIRVVTFSKSSQHETLSRVINKIIIRYHHHIHKLDDMIDELSSSTIFTKIDLHTNGDELNKVWVV